MSDLHELLSQLENESMSDSDKRAIILQIGDSGNKNAIPYLMEMFTTRDNEQGIRDALAMSLGDLGANEAVPFIINLIRRPENENTRGTLIYALQNLDCIDYFLYFIELVCTANYECEMMSYNLIEKYAKTVDLCTKEKALELLNAYEAQLLDDESIVYRESRLDFIEETRELLE